MQDSEYTIKAVGKTVKPWNSQYGPMLTYLVQLEGDGEPVQLNKKDSSSRPQAGDPLYGHIEETDFGRKFKAVKNPNFSGSGGASKSSGYQESPEKQASIHRSVALNNAAVVYQGSGEKASVILDTADAFDEWLNKNTAIAKESASLKDEWDKTVATKEDVVVDLDDSDEQSLLDRIPF